MSERLFGTDTIEATMKAVTPMRRLGSVEEIAESIIWLCSDRASFITGTGISADGGKRAG
jgi:NAD(P)-dependent dehydrogenase (short-subunit alcohol dehydrogenase family)